MATPRKKEPYKDGRGFTLMTPEKRREAAAKGGREAHANGRAYHFTSETAREAGKKGGTSVSKNKEHMREIGRRGAAAKYKNREKV